MRREDPRPEARRLREEEIREIYYAHLLRQFPPDEVKPFERIHAQLERDMYFGFSLTLGEELLGYAFFNCVPGLPFLMLDYYAVLEPYQDQGWGSRFLSLLREELSGYGSVLAEAEDPESGQTAEARREMERRVRFYLRNGFRDTSIRVNLYFVDYAILELPLREEADPGKTREGLDRLYRAMLGEMYFTRLTYLGSEEHSGPGPE